MATTSIPHQWKYDVYVSFRGDDIRKNFMDRMFNDFNQKGIYAFRDDRELPKGEDISPHLYKAIEESRFLIVVFSKNYASSSWCLHELVKIIDCKQIECPRYEVHIVFYDVKPDVVRKQTHSYAEAFAKHQLLNRPEVDNWKEALSMAANLSGWDLQDMTNGYEYKLIDCISKCILKNLCDGPLHVGENLVGIDFHFEKLNLSRFVGSSKVNMIGICGISGIGKTTLARAIYNLMYVHFDGSCFCDDVRKQQDLTQVQMQMIGKIIEADMKISSVGEGIMAIKKILSSKPILLVLDDVDDHEQLEALAGSASWFCPGSLIIFTGKDKQLLRSHRVDEIYDMYFLNEDQSLDLLRFYAFKEKESSRGFEEAAEKVVRYVQGHPLALKVLGRFLYGKTVGQWVSELNQLEVHPNKKIQQVLRLSYDGLNLHQQNILLDIACSFIGENRDFAASVLDGCNFFAETNLQVLVDKSLITISSNNSLQMHDLIQAMATEIVREESNTPGNQSRLWVNPSEIYNILSEKKATQAVEIIDPLQMKSSQKFDIDGNAFAQLKNLRILKLSKTDDVNFFGRLEFLSNKLRWLYWYGCPFKLLPSDFYPINIVVIDLYFSKIKHFWTTPKCFKSLKVMKLRYCRSLTSTPDFSEITNLEELDLEGCMNLSTLHPSVGMLKKLVVLNLKHCTQVRSLPSNVGMDSLQILNLSGCLKLYKLPEALGRFKNLMELHVDSTAITELPSFVSSLGSLKSLSFSGQGRIRPRWWTSITYPFGLLSKKQHPQRSLSLSSLHMLNSLNLGYCSLEQMPESIGGLSCLKNLNLSGNNLLEVPESIGGLSCLTHLYLEGNNLSELPESIGGLSCLLGLDLQGNNFTILPSLSQLFSLDTLELSDCKKLEVLPELPPTLGFISACDCTSLREVSGSSKDPFRYNIFYNCPNLFKNVNIDSEGSISKTESLDSSITSQGLIHHLSAFLGYVGFQTNICQFFLEDTEYNSCLDIAYRGNNIPEWFTIRSTKNHVMLELPSHWCADKFRGFETCYVFKCKRPFNKSEGCSVKNFDGASLTPDYKCPHVIREFFKESTLKGIHDSYIIWLHYERVKTGAWKEAKNFVTFSLFENNKEDVEVKEFGVRLIFDEDIQQEADLSMLKSLPTPTQHGGALSINRAFSLSYLGLFDYINWSW